MQIEDMNSQAQLSAAQQLASGGGAGVTNLESSGAAEDGDDDDEIPELETAEEDGPVDETGVDPKDIDLVMAQVRLFFKIVLAPSFLTIVSGELLSREGGSGA